MFTQVIKAGKQSRELLSESVDQAGFVASANAADEAYVEGDTCKLAVSALVHVVKAFAHINRQQGINHG
ncbi:hypothetical protein [Aliamphritea hakodatensis]|uniref:hypothetical protein n=1 Tax=Aliamphritea hakodatensis TaxID=2895352 RepID=UPI0022FD378E|nr:hypothetical protein [Aliamphritea hakodatensis]